MDPETSPLQERTIEQPSSAASSPRYFAFGAFHLDLQKRQLLKHGAPLRLQGKVFESLVVLIERAGEVVNREALRSRLWPTSQINCDANVNTTINKLRQALGDSADQPIFVATVPRKGYRFIAKLEGMDSCPTAKSASPSMIAVKGGHPASAHSIRASMWLASAAVVLLLAGVLFGAALVLYTHRHMPPSETLHTNCLAYEPHT
ncbi:MAG: hypothetical protein NVS9B4_16410 [Candidatus Acidiferrum sp.]